MFDSLKAWCRFPVFLHKYIGTDITGDVTYAEPVEVLGYRVDEMRNITDKYGKQYVSQATVYFQPTVDVTEADCLSFDTGPKYEIRKLGGYFDGNTGALSIKVAYL